MKNGERMTEINCPQCGAPTIETRNERDTFYYGVDDRKVELTTVIPVHTCTACGFE